MNCSVLPLLNRRIDDDKGRTHELEYSAIKCMRGILYCYMRQANKVTSICEFWPSHKINLFANYLFFKVYLNVCNIPKFPLICEETFNYHLWILIGDYVTGKIWLHRRGCGEDLHRFCWECKLYLWLNDLGLFSLEQKRPSKELIAMYHIMRDLSFSHSGVNTSLEAHIWSNWKKN